MANTMTKLAIILTFVARVVGYCECGYSAVVDMSGPEIFTDLIESDFIHIGNITKDTDWKPQNFSVTPAAGRGPYGMNFTTPNVLSNSVGDRSNWTGPGKRGGDPGLQFIVMGGLPITDYVPVAQMNSAREDLLWGSYRASLKLTPLPGTCSAFFWYFNDTQEIDMEFLSNQFNFEKKTFPVNLVLQSPEAALQGYNAQGTGNYIISYLPFDPTTDFHEYRIDFVPGKVVYYADGVVLATMKTSAVPTEPGHMILTQWSNGNSLWSAGPPVADATMTVAYVKAYFNSSRPDRNQNHASRCKKSVGPGAICNVPDVGTATSESSGNLTDTEYYFFVDQQDMANDQIFYYSNDAAAGGRWGTSDMLLILFFYIHLVYLLQLLWELFYSPPYMCV